MSVYGGMYKGAQCPRKQEASDPPGAEVIGSCELPNCEWALGVKLSQVPCKCTACS